MAGQGFKIDYEKLQQISQIFQQQAQNAEDTLNLLKSHSEQLRNTWSGVAADKYQAEMEQSVYPRLKKLADNLQQVSTQVGKLSTGNRGFEDMAKGVFREIQIAPYWTRL